MNQPKAFPEAKRLLRDSRPCDRAAELRGRQRGLSDYPAFAGPLGYYLLHEPGGSRSESRGQEWGDGPAGSPHRIRVHDAWMDSSGLAGACSYTR
jgi:hypothetical protein